MKTCEELVCGHFARMSLACLAAVLLLVTPASFAGSLSKPDAAFVLQAAGDVRSSTGKPVAALTKLRLEEEVTVGAAGKIEIIYMDTGRKELWGRPGMFRVGYDESEALKGEPTKVGILSVNALNQLKAYFASGGKEGTGVKTGGVRLRVDD